MNKIDKERYEIAYLYFKEFKFHNPVVGERFNYEPQSNKVYRALKDKKANTWKVPIDTNAKNTDGILFDKLEDETSVWSYDAIEISFDSVVDEKIPESEVKKILKWEDQSEWQDSFMRMILFPRETDPEELVEDPVEDTTEVNIVVKNNDPFADALASLLDDYIEIVEARDGVAVVIASLMEYLKTTYSDKYTDTSSPLDTKDWLYHDRHGKTINCFNAVKYINRYLSSGYDKSENPIDLYKAIHYMLFELARLKLKELNTENEQERNTRATKDDKGPKRADRNVESPSSDTKGTPKRKRGRPRKNDKG